MAKPREPKRRDDGPNRYDVMPELPCFAAFRFDFVFLCFCFPGIFAVVVFTYLYHLIPLQLLLAFNTFLILAKARRKRIKEPQWIWYHFIYKQSILLCTHRADQVTPHKTGSPPLSSPLSPYLSVVPPSCLFSSFSVSFVAFSIWKLIRSNGMIWWFLRSPSEIQFKQLADRQTGPG